MRTVVMSVAVLLSTAFLHTLAVAGPIHDAARGGKVEQVERLIAAGTAVDEKDGMDKTALHWAAGEGHMEMSRMLVAKGADVNAKDFQDGTPLFYAVWEAHEESVEFLIGKGADVNQKYLDGYSMLDDAVKRGRKGIAKKLLRAGAKCGTSHSYSDACNREVGQN
jgi:ankyrin repeat protein